ncbi:hypothetical protein ZWY2020_038086 [Hordeum vulgare]|nr:hypothetical protein ZWY2020_038086 [Hordeum vulgare]
MSGKGPSRSVPPMPGSSGQYDDRRPYAPAEAGQTAPSPSAGKALSTTTTSASSNGSNSHESRQTYKADDASTGGKTTGPTGKAFSRG